MKKLALIAFLSLASTNSYAESKESQFDPNFLKPETVDKLVDIAIEQNEKNMGPIADLYHQYMASFTRYAEKQIEIFKKHFIDDVGQADKGYIPVKKVD